MSVPALRGRTGRYARPALALALGMLGACRTVGPDYHLPAEAAINRGGAQAAFLDSGGARVAPGQPLPERWWSLYADPRLDALVQRTGRPQEEAYLEAVVDLAAVTGTPVVATNEVCFLQREDFEAHEARVCIHDGATLDDPRRPRRYSDQQYLRTPAEMAELFADWPEALENSVEIARRCNLRLELGKNVLPDFPVPAGMTTADYFTAQARAGLEQRLPRLLDPTAPDFAARRQPYDARLELELGDEPVVALFGLLGAGGLAGIARHDALEALDLLVEGAL